MCGGLIAFALTYANWYSRIVLSHMFPILLLAFWCFCAIGAATAWQLWKPKIYVDAAAVVRAPEPRSSLRRWLLALVILCTLPTLYDAANNRAWQMDVGVVGAVLMMVAGFHFGRCIVLARRERLTSTMMLRRRPYGRRLGRRSRIAVPLRDVPGNRPGHWRALIATAVAISFVAILGSLGTTHAWASAPPDAYPYKHSPMDHRDRWGMDTRECTSYVAWRLNVDNHIPFTTNYRGALWWNASTWYRAARTAGIPVDDDPTPGSVMVLQPGVSGAGKPGHVAIVVEELHGWVLVDQYNAGGKGTFSRGWIPRAAYPGMAFIHFPVA
jgi:surface antigen